MHSSRALVYRLGSSVSHLRCHSLQLLGHAKHTSAFLPPATAQTHRTTTPHKLCAASVRSFLDNNNSHKRRIQPTSAQNALGESAIRMKRKEGPRPSQFVTSQMPLTTYTSHYATPACSFLHCAHSHNSHPCSAYCFRLPLLKRLGQHQFTNCSLPQSAASWLRINNSHLCCHSMQLLFLDIQNSRLRCFRLSLLKRIGQQQYCKLRICCLSLQPLGERQLTSTLLQPISSQTPWTTAIRIHESEWDLGLRNLSLLKCP